MNFERMISELSPAPDCPQKTLLVRLVSDTLSSIVDRRSTIEDRYFAWIHIMTTLEDHLWVLGLDVNAEFLIKRRYEQW